MNKTVISPQFASVLQRKLQQLDMNPHVLAGSMGMAYDHIRKIYNGQHFPGPASLRAICKKLGLNLEEMQKLIAQDRMKQKGITSAATGRDRSFIMLEPLWDHLTPGDREEIQMIVQAKVKRNITAQAELAKAGA